MAETTVLTESLRDDLEMTIVEIARMLEEGQEFEATEKAKSVCDTLRSLEQSAEVDEIRSFMNETTDYHLAV